MDIIRSHHSIVLVLALVLGSITCSSPAERTNEAEDREAPSGPSPVPAKPEQTVAPPELEIHGSVHEMMMMGEIQARVQIADAAASPTSYALGAIGDLRGEVTVVAGESWLAYPDGADEVRLEVTKSPQEGAGLLVVAEVERWISTPVEADVALSELGQRIAQQAQAAGWAGEGAMPFLIEGPVAKLDWHVIDGSRIEAGAQGHAAHRDAAVKGQLEGRSSTLVGFYSTEHQGVFTHRDSTVHVHFIDAEHQLSGHVDAVTVLQGATLKLPSS